MVRLRRGRAAGTILVIGAVTLSGLLAGCGSSHHTPSAADCRAAASATATSGPATGQSAGQPPVPSHGAYFGGFSLTGVATQANLLSSFDRLGTQACRPLAIGHVYLRWGTTFPTSSAQAMVTQGAYPLVSWTGTDTRTIASGAVDPMIRSTAQQIAELHSPVFLEFRWEMDRPNLSSDVHSPADYVAAWDHIHQVFAASGVHNVSWVWCPTAAGFAAGRAQAYYPGDSEVDWVCTDAYPSPDFGNATYFPLSHLLRPFLNWAKGHAKPVMIGEFGVPRTYTTAQRVDWLTAARTTIMAVPKIKAVVYFDYDPVGVSTDRKYGLGTDPAVLKAFRSLASDSYFTPRVSS